MRPPPRRRAPQLPATRTPGRQPVLPKPPGQPVPARPRPPTRRRPPADLPARRTNYPRPEPPRHKDREARQELAVTEIAGHLTFTVNTVTAWYWLPEMRWAFRPDRERENLIIAIAEQYAGLAGMRLHLRRTTRPFPADEWARTVAGNTPYPLPPAPGAPTWADHLVAAQRHLLATNSSEGQTYLGITFTRRGFGDVWAEKLNRWRGKGTTDKERQRTRQLVEQFDEVLGAFGMRGRRVTSRELEWPLYRSVALCMSPPNDLSPVSDGHWDHG
ncbi:MAG TPA: hypothetical protein VHJ83_09745, partial [Micromonosporaceae bacterium]|nr:hypothetical protein [Micromonosporaceae bacterium]